MSFYTILTAIGKAKLANAQVQGTAVNLTQMAVGDGNGAYYEPTEAQTALVREKWRGNINRIITDQTNPNWIVIEMIIPTTEGGFTVREAGVFDDAGNMIAIGKYPETYKPTLAEGSGKDLYIRMILEVTNVSTVTLKIDPAVVLASRSYVDQEIAIEDQKIISHTNNTGIHVTRNVDGDLVEDITGNAATATLATTAQNALLSKKSQADEVKMLAVWPDLVLKLKKNSMTLTDDNTCNTLLFYNNYLYAGTQTGYLIRINISNMTIDSRVSSTIGLIKKIITDGTYLYITNGTASIVKFNPNTMTKVGATLTLTDPNEDAITSMITDGTYVYVGSNRQPGRIVKINPNGTGDLSRVSHVAFDTGENGCYDLVYMGNSFAYAVCPMVSNPAKVIKVNLSTMAKVTTFTAAAGENTGQKAISDGTYLYIAIGPDLGSATKIVKLNPTTMTQIGTTLTLDTNDQGIKDLSYDGRFLYACFAMTPGRVVKIDPNNFARVSLLSIDSNIKALTTDGANLYFGTSNNPAKIYQRDLYSSFE
jgi:hypothetical protein